MKEHTKVYLDHFDEGDDFLPCEVCGSTLNDVHHISAKGMGGVHGQAVEDAEAIENLIGLCRGCHTKAHQDPVGDYTKESLTEIHLNNL